MPQKISKDIEIYYNRGKEQKRLFSGSGNLERSRTLDILHRNLPKSPAVIYDIGGGAGVYAFPLQKEGYKVSLIDPVELHIKQAKDASKRNKIKLEDIRIGDARDLPYPSGSADVVLFFGPLYHLASKGDRIKSLKEAYRVLKPRGLLFAAGISRFASYMDGMYGGMVKDPLFLKIMQRDLKSGQHKNPTSIPHYFTTAYLHHPSELKKELQESHFKVKSILAVEGPVWNSPEFDSIWNRTRLRNKLLSCIRNMEFDSSIIGASAHLIVIGKK